MGQGSSSRVDRILPWLGRSGQKAWARYIRLMKLNSSEFEKRDLGLGKLARHMGSFGQIDKGQESLGQGCSGGERKLGFARPSQKSSGHESSSYGTLVKEALPANGVR